MKAEQNMNDTQTAQQVKKYLQVMLGQHIN